MCYRYEKSCIYVSEVWEVVHICARGMRGRVYICVRCIDFACFYDFSIRFRNYSDRLVFVFILFLWILIMNKNKLLFHMIITTFISPVQVKISHLFSWWILRLHYIFVFVVVWPCCTAKQLTYHYVCKQQIFYNVESGSFLLSLCFALFLLSVTKTAISKKKYGWK